MRLGLASKYGHRLLFTIRVNRYVALQYLSSGDSCASCLGDTTITVEILIQQFIFFFVVLRRRSLELSVRTAVRGVDVFIR